MAKMSRLSLIHANTSANCAVVTLGSCVAVTHARAALWEELISPAITAKYRPFELRKIPTFSQTNLAFARNTYYGEFTDTVPSVDSVYEEFSFTEKPKSRWKDFEAAKERGDIVLHPLERLSGSIQMGIGAWSSSITSRSSATVAHNAEGKAFPFVNTGCLSYTRGRQIPQGVAAVGVNADSEFLPTTFNYEVITAPSFGLPMSVESARTIRNSVVNDLQSQVVSTLLVTETRAKASEGLLDLSTTLAEAPELVRYIYDKVNQSLKLYVRTKKRIKELKRRPHVAAADLVSEIADAWLQYRYAIMPNVYTVQSTLEYLKSEVALYQTVRNGSSFTLTPPTIAGWTAQDLEVNNRCFIKNRFDLLITQADQYLKASLTNTAWELAKRSFILDWFINVGDLLSALTPPKGSIQEAAMYSWKAKETLLYRNPDWVGPPLKVDLEFYRAIIIDPGTSIGISAQFDMNWKRWLDASALSWSASKDSIKSQLRKLK